MITVPVWALVVSVTAALAALGATGVLVLTALLGYCSEDES
jgi:hypothetical protein